MLFILLVELAFIYKFRYTTYTCIILITFVREHSLLYKDTFRPNLKLNVGMGSWLKEVIITRWGFWSTLILDGIKNTMQSQFILDVSLEVFICLALVLKSARPFVHPQLCPWRCFPSIQCKLTNTTYFRLLFHTTHCYQRWEHSN